MDDLILQHLIAWGEQHTTIRAAILTSTRAHPNPMLDPFSDYDLIYVVMDLSPWFEDRTWLSTFGTVIALYRDPIHDGQFAYITQYPECLKIDFTLMTIERFKQLATLPALPAELDDGYRVLLDKDGLAAQLQPPTYSAYRINPPGENEYLEAIHTFLHEATYGAKNLWRDHLFPAKYSLDTVMKQTYLRQMLEWRAGLDHRWRLRAGNLGKGLKHHLPAALWTEVEATWVGAHRDENWEALFRLIDLYQRLAIEIGTVLGYQYPTEQADRLIAYLQDVRTMGN